MNKEQTREARCRVLELRQEGLSNPEIIEQLGKEGVKIDQAFLSEQTREARLRALELRGEGLDNEQIIKQMNEEGAKIDKTFFSEHPPEAKRFKRSGFFVPAIVELMISVREDLGEHSPMRRWQQNKLKWLPVLEFFALRMVQTMKEEGFPFSEKSLGLLEDIEDIELGFKVFYGETNA